MNYYKILFYPDKRLRKKAKSVTKINNYIKKISKNMINTMKLNKGIGLAATQVNINKKIIVIKIKKKSIVLINPIIINKKNNIISKESCLSILNKEIKIKRYKKIKVIYINLKNKKIKFNFKNILSICIQHEIDHLSGKLIID